MEFDALAFVSDYRMERDLRCSGSSATHWFTASRSDATTRGASDRPTVPQFVVEITPNGAESWVGIIEGGAGGLSGAFGAPSASTVALVVRGLGYWVPVRAPETFQVAPVYPVKQVFRVADRPIMVLADFTRAAAYGPEGLLWLTDDLSWDGLEFIEVGAAAIRGFGWDATIGRQVEFTIDVATGASVGGARPSD